MVERPRLLVVEHQRNAGLGRFAAPLAATGVALDVRRPAEGDAVPTDPAGLAGLLVLGGDVAAWEDERCAWLPATRDLLRAATAAGVPTLGICLGAQLLALALGGRVTRGAAGPELGLCRVRWTAAAADDAVLHDLPDRALAPQGHTDAVTRLPGGAVLLATSPRYQNQAFRVGPRAWGLQWHPEVTRADFAGWMRADAARPDVEPGFDADAEVAAYDARESELAATWEPVARRFGALVRDAVAAR